MGTIQQRNARIKFEKAAEVATDMIFKILTVFVILALVIGTSGIFLDMGKVFKGRIDAGFNVLVTDILGMMVVLELFKGLMEYFELHRARITLMTDMTLIFTMRELMVALYRHSLNWKELAAMSLLITALGALRVMAITISPAGTEIKKDLDGMDA